MLLASSALAGYYPRPAYHGVDHGAAVDCWDCHWFDAENAFNAQHVSPMVIGAGGNAVQRQLPRLLQDFVNGGRTGICQVCHTRTKYWGASYDWQSPGFPAPHFAGENCLSCHPHWQPENLFRPQMKGPAVARHAPDRPQGAAPARLLLLPLPGRLQPLPGRPAPSTPPRSVTSATARMARSTASTTPWSGAKPNWLHGVYDGDQQLKAGKEHWCDGCHDGGTSQVKGVQAPNVLGDNSHLRLQRQRPRPRPPDTTSRCLDCQLRPAYEHCDGEPAPTTAPCGRPTPATTSRATGSRPRSTSRKWNAFAATDYTLCLSCHDSARLFDNSGIMMTNFRNDRSTQFPSKNLPLPAPDPAPGRLGVGPLWDSDWDGSNIEGSGDSTASCPACHNVHGSPTPEMTRHGELMGLGSQGLDFHWFKQDGTTDTDDRRWPAAGGPPTSTTAPTASASAATAIYSGPLLPRALPGAGA